MSVKIDFDNPKTQIITKWFFGNWTDGNSIFPFTIFASWTELNGWIIDSIEWDKTAPIDDSESMMELESEIEEKFIEKLTE